MAWLEDSNTAQTKLDEGKYLMASGVPKSVTKQANGTNKKRTADSSDEEDADVQQPPAKKQKDGQKARSDAVQVRVDTGCSLVGKKTRRHDGAT